jgi:hypothetical protein
MTQGRPNYTVELKDLETRIRKGRLFELKAKAIEVSIYEIEKFYPDIRIVRRRPDAQRPKSDKVFGRFAENALSKVV